jgi:DNA polymerase V
MISIQLPLFEATISAGFPSMAENDCQQTLDLNEWLIKHPAATFFLRVRGDSMVGAGIHDQDVLIVDKSLKATEGKIVIASLNGELTVKRLQKIQGRLFLAAENCLYQPIEITEDMDFRIWGVVTSVIHLL